MRLFLAVFPPAAVQRAARAVSDALRHPGDGVSWVKADNLHFTLRFLGEVGEDGERRAAEAARVAAASEPAFGATLGAPGAFPDARRARVVWLGLAAGAEPLMRLAHALESELRARGFDRADLRFSPHLTLGRVRTPGADWSARLTGAAPAGATFRVERVSLVESELSPAGSRYTVRDEGRLG